ncbi:VCBS domain-containing protein [Methyloprofundus sedimenti]|nr:VCBS domain-containing protein [Methyloprofundus sedimenti]
MHIKHISLLAALLLFSSFNVSALSIGGNTGPIKTDPAPANSFPDANDDHNSTVVISNTSASGDVSANDFYATSFTLGGSWVGTYGLITAFDSNGEYTYELFDGTTNDSLPSNGIGTDRFQYTCLNATGNSDAAWLIIDVRASQIKPPVAQDDYNSTVVNVLTSATGNVGDNDLNGSIFTLNGSKTGQYGLLTSFTSTGAYTYELYVNTNSSNLPASGVATDVFTYTYANENGVTDTATLFIDISANPAKPIANDDRDSTIVGVSTSVTGNVSINDHYGSNYFLLDSKVGQYGFLTSFSSTGEYTYELYASTDNFRLPSNGVANEHFKYTYANESGLTVTAWLVIDVNPNPNQPIANDDYISTIAGVYTIAEGNVGINDRYGSIFTLETSWTGKYGSITFFDSEGKYTYELFEGTDSTKLPADGVGIDRFRYTYSNAQGSSDTAWLIIDVSSNTTLPIAEDDFNSAVIGFHTVATGNVTDNDRYGSIATLYDSGTGLYGTITSFSATGAYTYTLFEDADLTLPAGEVARERFLYIYSNAQGLSDSAWLTIEVSANPVQPKAPIANDDYISTVIGLYPTATGNVSNNDFYGSIYSLDQSWLGQYGAITAFNSEGEFTYTLYDSTTIASLPADGVGIDSFTYTYANDKGITANARIIIDVRGNPTHPIANDDYISTVVNTLTTATGNASINDLYGSIYTLPGSWVGQYGSITSFNSDGTFSYQLFASTSNESLPVDGPGIERFQYTLANAKGITDTAWIIIDVQPDPAQANTPIANADQASVVINARPTVSGNVIDNDRYGTIVNFTGSSTGKYGFLDASGTSGQFTYQLFPSTTNIDLPATGTDTETFPYTLSDIDGKTDTSILLINVTADPSGSDTLIARDDHATYISNKTLSLAGDVTLNDSNGDYVVLTSPPSTEYGRIVLQSNGSYIYELYETSFSVIKLKAGEVVTDEYIYQYFTNAGASATAKLIVQIIGNPVDADGNTIFENPFDEPYDNVDVEFNDSSGEATPLNSGRNIKGHLHEPGDKDWYYLNSAGNEIITLEVCPVGTSCFGKKSWVLYVFDSAEIAGKEADTVALHRWVDETGTNKNLTGSPIIKSVAGESNHMYLAYKKGFFDGALIGIVDPCFDTLNAVDIGVGDGAKDYFIAISSPLKGDSGGADSCGEGSVVLERPGPPAAGKDAEDIAKVYATTEEYIEVFPYSDDQYAIKITSTGLPPLLTDAAALSSATFDSNTGALEVPKVRVNDQVFQASLNLQAQEARSANNTLKFTLSDIGALNLEEMLDAYRATYNPANQQVLIPRVTHTNTGDAYSVILQYHVGNNEGADAWLEAISIVKIE